MNQGKNHERICWIISKNIQLINDEEKKAKDTKKSVIIRKVNFKDNKNCSEAAELVNKIKHLKN